MTLLGFIVFVLSTLSFILWLSEKYLDSQDRKAGFIDKYDEDLDY